MLKIGLTGGIASGKSTVCQLFSNLGIAIIDADIIARELVEPDKPALLEIIETFGKQIIQSDGTLNRTSLRKQIFSTPKKKIQLENILHPKIRQQLNHQSKQIQADYCILAIPLLIESQLTNTVNRILVIDVKEEEQLKRLLHREDINLSDAQKIINSQCSRQQRLAVANDVIINNQSIEELKKGVISLDKKYRSLANSTTSSCQHVDTNGQ